LSKLEIEISHRSGFRQKAVNAESTVYSGSARSGSAGTVGNFRRVVHAPCCPTPSGCIRKPKNGQIYARTTLTGRMLASTGLSISIQTAAASSPSAPNAGPCWRAKGHKRVKGPVCNFMNFLEQSPGKIPIGHLAMRLPFVKMKCPLVTDPFTKPLDHSDIFPLFPPYCFITTNTLLWPANPPGSVKQVIVFVAVIGLPAGSQGAGPARLVLVSTL
jgi:hypothetical protein